MTPRPQVRVPVGTREPTGLSFSKRFQTLRGVLPCVHVHTCICAYNLPKYSLKIKRCICNRGWDGGSGECVYAGAGEVRSEHWMG